MVGKWGVLESHASLHSGVFSDGNFTYTVEPRVLVESQEVPQVGPPTALGPATVPPTLGNLSLPALLGDPSSSVPSVPQVTSLLAPVSFAPITQATPGP